MRKIQKKQIEDMLELLSEAHQEIKYTIENGNTNLTLDLLAQCQQSAISAENMIVALEGEAHITISYLESYCDALFRVYEVVRNSVQNTAQENTNRKEQWQQSMQEDIEAIIEEGISVVKAERNDAEEQGVENDILIKEIQAELEEALTQICNSVQQDIKVRKEVVFLPYKASMWDSLESVWKAADEDPECDAYVVPIPYYDKSADGGFREFHYEGKEYPNYVPITDYRTYDLAKRRPDIIFIHNPYDETNYITSIHPEFYSDRLNTYTDKLVYIPYFVLGEQNWENMSEEAKERMRMFCLQPGVLNSHKTIVQSEAMKKIYINTLCNELGEQSRKLWEERILGLGSPKLDKVNTMTADNITIPEEWKSVLYGTDGCMKKVILYNTSIHALEKNGDKMLAKMRRVFETFEENKDQVALLWRPHPLIKATIESMLPNLWTEYEKLVNEYREASWGIYDDTPDLNRAIELADAYYGDGSSLVQLCQEKGLLCMLQVVEE